MADGFDLKELTNFEKNLMKLANDTMPKESKKFLKKEGKSLLQETQSEAIFSGIKHKTHNYYDSIKQGKVYKYSGNGAWANRVYATAPHAHLLEEGHRMVTHDGKEVGFIKGYDVFGSAEKKFREVYFSDVQDFLDNILDKGL
jgi:hypothetical protein